MAARGARIRRAAASLAAVAAVLGGALAQAAPLPCVPRAQFEDAVVFLLPGLLRGVGRKCAPSLPAGALLGSGAAGFADRFRTDSDAAWPSARAAIMQVAGDNLPEFLDDETLRGLVEGLAGGAVVEKVELKDCAVANRAVEAMAPLPARNIARLATLMVELDGRKPSGDSRKLPFALCPPPAPR